MARIKFFCYRATAIDDENIRFRAACMARLIGILLLARASLDNRQAIIEEIS